MSYPLSKNMIFQSRVLYSDNVILAVGQLTKLRAEVTCDMFVANFFQLGTPLARSITRAFPRALETRCWASDSFRRGCTVSLQEGATMSEYTVDWAINVSVGVQTFFFPLISLYHIPLRRATSHAARRLRRRLSELRSIDAETNSRRNSIEFHFETIDAKGDLILNRLRRFA